MRVSGSLPCSRRADAIVLHRQAPGNSASTVIVARAAIPNEPSPARRRIQKMLETIAKPRRRGVQQ